MLMIVVLTGNYRGGVYQFAQHIVSVFHEMGKSVVLFAPENSEYITESMQTYERKNSLNPLNRYYQEIADRISERKPELVFVCDSNLVTARIVLSLNRTIPVYMCVHDIKAHPNYKATIQYLKDMIKRPYIRAAWRMVKKVVVLSEHSKNELTKYYPAIANKIGIVRLGAHPPRTVEKSPEELKIETDYFLFFGRMDKYKGIENLLRAYTESADNMPYQLVLAGNGLLTEREEALITAYPKNITLIKRYIQDEEMVWLFQHARCIVLPYIEASQSGVLSMAYHYGKSVVASDLDGLKEFIEIGKTGLVYSDIDQLRHFLMQIDQILPENRKWIDEYVKQNLDWSVNIQKCLMEDL